MFMIAPTAVTLSESEGSDARVREMLRGVDTQRSECAQYDKAFTPMGVQSILLKSIIGPWWIFHYPD